MMNHLSARNQIIIATLVLVVVAVAFIFLAILPLFQQAADVDKQIATQKTELVNAQAVVARRQSYKAQAAQNEVELMHIANQVPDAPQLPSVIIDLQDAANACDLDFPTITVGALTPKTMEDGTTAPYTILPINLVVSGKWADIIDYYRQLDKFDRGVRVTSSQFSYVAPTEETKAHVQANVSLEVYMMAAAPPLVKEQPGAPESTVSPEGTTQSQ